MRALARIYWSTNRLSYPGSRWAKTTRYYTTRKRLSQNTLRQKSNQLHTKAALLGVGVCLSAFALPSPWSWLTFILGLQLFSPIVGRSLKNNSDAERQRIIADIHARLEVLDREILKGDPNETGLTTHNKRIEYNTLARLLERLSKED